MYQVERFNFHTPLFSSEKRNRTIVIRFREDLLFRAMSLNAKNELLHHLEFLENQDIIAAIVVSGQAEKPGVDEYLDFYRKMLRSSQSELLFERFHNGVNQYIMKMLSLKKVVIQADAGMVIPLFFNVSLAADLRIVADNTVYLNPQKEFGLIPKGGGGYFLSTILGRGKLTELMISGDDLDAQAALHLGIVQKVVPASELENEALEMAGRLEMQPCGWAGNIKQLINHDLKQVNSYLEFENKLIRNAVHSETFRQSLDCEITRK